MVDVSKTIAPRSDQLNYDDLIAGPRTITITRVEGRESADQPLSVYFEGDNNKPWKPALTMRRVLVQVWGNEGNDYVGRRLTLFGDPEVVYGGVKVGGIRISHMSHIDRPVKMMLTKTRGKKAPYTVEPLGETADKDIVAKARAEAARGTDAFNTFWNLPEAKQHRGVLREHLDEFKSIAAAADEAERPLSQRVDTSEDTGDVIEGDTAPDDGTKAKRAFAEGALAHAEGKQDTDCPYVDDPEKTNWLNGWFKAEEDK